VNEKRLKENLETLEGDIIKIKNLQGQNAKVEYVQDCILYLKERIKEIKDD
tara:strand:- start:70 stop:222 length:153 start_codon:yes stop_codon:yes gene_type:complete